MKEELIKFLEKLYSHHGSDALCFAQQELVFLKKERNEYVGYGKAWPECKAIKEALLSFFIIAQSCELLRLKYTQEMASIYVTELADKHASKRANDARYKEYRQNLTKVAAVAQRLWHNGSMLKHHQMKKYLAEEYQNKDGKYPFLNLPEKAILKTCKKVAVDMNRPDLISGLKK